MPAGAAEGSLAHRQPSVLAVSTLVPQAPFGACGYVREVVSRKESIPLGVWMTGNGE